MTTLIIQIKPTIDSLESDETDGINEGELELEQIGHLREVEVESGNEFTIEDDEEATVVFEEHEYKYEDRDEPGFSEHYNVGDTISLEPGKYLFHDDGITIEKKG